MGPILDSICKIVWIDDVKFMDNIDTRSYFEQTGIKHRGIFW